MGKHGGRWSAHFGSRPMIKSIISHIKSILNELDYTATEIAIMSDAVRYGLDADVVDVWLESNYVNHYDVN